MDAPREDQLLYANALRMLFLLNAAGGDISGVPHVAGAVAVLRSQKRLSALHFWMRNPDHLVAALLRKMQRENDPSLLPTAKKILDEREPELRRVPMQKYLRGAWEPVDTGMAVLVTNGLAHYRRIVANPGTKIVEHLYYLLQAGRELAHDIVVKEAALDWYRERAELVAAIGPNFSASELKDLQYLEPEYARAKKGAPIASIADRVRQRYAEVAEEFGQ